MKTALDRLQFEADDIIDDSESQGNDAMDVSGVDFDDDFGGLQSPKGRNFMTANRGKENENGFDRC